MTPKGREERFPPTRLSAGYGFRKETIAGVRHKGRDMPAAAILLTGARAPSDERDPGRNCQGRVGLLPSPPLIDDSYI